MIEQICEELFSLQDEKYRDFQCSLLPTVEPGSVIGVRTPALRALAKKLQGSAELSVFLADLPHRYFEENQLHAFLVSGIRELDACLAELDRFLPYVDNWATCDQTSPAVFKMRRPELPAHIERWISSQETYTVRFGIKMLMEHFLDADFDPCYPERVAALRSEEYYVNMMIAWFFATALAKQYDAVLPLVENGRLDLWTHNMTIRKAAESYRIAPERKAYLKSLRRKA